MHRYRKQKPEIRRRDILDAARHVLVLKGYHDFRMNEVARKAKIGIGTLYLYFKDKGDIFAAVFSDLLDQVDERIKMSVGNKKGLEAVREMAKENLDFMDKHQDFLAQFRPNHPGVKGTMAGQRFKERFEKHMALFTGRMQECIKEGTVKPMDARLLGIYFNFLARMFMVYRRRFQSRHLLSSYTSNLMDIFLHGVGTK